MAIVPRDESAHEHTPERLWRESFYANFHDRTGKYGGMATVGILPNQDRYEGFAVIFLGWRQVLFYHTQGSLQPGTAGLHHVPGISYDVLSPLRQCRFGVAAGFLSLDPYQAAQCNTPGGETVSVPAGFEINFEALDPPYEFPEKYGLLAGPARHFEQNGRVSGRITVEDQHLEVGGFGCRDRTWGIRDLSITDRGGAIFAQLGPQFTVNVLWSESERQPGAVGYIHREGTNLAIRQAHVTVKTDPLLPAQVRAALDTEGGAEFLLEAATISVMPIISTARKGRFYWYECLTCFQSGSEFGFGITEIAQWKKDRTG